MELKPYGRIYLIRNVVNGKIYIGQTTLEIYERWEAHYKAALRGSKDCPLFYNAIRKHGHENFRVFELGSGYSTQTELNDAETREKAAYNATDREIGYNINPVSSGPGPHTQEEKDLIGDSKKGKPRSPETRAKCSKANMGKKPSPETREKLRKAQQNRAPATPETCAKISAAKKGVKQTPTHRAANAAAKRGRKQKPEAVVKRAASLRATLARKRAARASASAHPVLIS